MLRLATINDAEAIANIHVTSWHETYRGIIPESYLSKLNVAERQAMWTTALERGQSIAVVEVNGNVVGFANGGKNRDQNPLYPGELYAIYLLKQFHGRGIGKQLFNEATQQLKDQNLFPFVTFVLADNPTLGFYHTMGAKIIGEHIEDFDGTQLKELQLLWE